MSRCPIVILVHQSGGLVGQRTRRLGIACLSPRPYPRRRPRGCQQTQKMVGASCFLLFVSSGEDGRQSAVIHDAGSRGTQTIRHVFSLVICTKKRLYEKPIGRQHHRRSTSEWSSSSTPSRQEPECESSLARSRRRTHRLKRSGGNSPGYHPYQD